MPRNAIIGAIVTFFLIAAVSVGVYLSQHPQILKSRAAGLIDGLAATCSNNVADVHFDVVVGSQTYKAVFYNMRTNLEIGRTYSFNENGGLRTTSFNIPSADVNDQLAVSIFLSTDPNNTEIGSTGFSCASPPPPPPQPITVTCATSANDVASGASVNWQVSVNLPDPNNTFVFQDTTGHNSSQQTGSADYGYVTAYNNTTGNVIPVTGTWTVTNSSTHGTGTCANSIRVLAPPAGPCGAYTPPNYGQACSSSINACNQTSAGTVLCDGSCSATTPPPNPPTYGQICPSAANNCNETNSGRIDCNGVCDATKPADKNSCTPSVGGDAPNCNGTCSGSTPICSNNTCVQCVANSDCSGGFQCNSSHVCVAPSSTVHQIQSCNTTGIGSGTQYCEGYNDALGQFVATSCWADETKKPEEANTCRYSLNLSCAPNSSSISIGGTTSWKVSYSSDIKLIPQVVMNNDPKQGTPGSPVLNGSQFNVTIPSQSYPAPGVIAPTTSLKFATGQSLPVACTPLTVGQSSLTATINLSPAGVKPNQEVTVTAAATDSSSDPAAAITTLEIFAAKANGAISKDECGQDLVNGVCRLGGRTDLSGSKTASTTAKWTPKIAGNYIVYATANSAGISCSGSRSGNLGTAYPCGNDSSKELSVGVVHATQFRIATDPVAFDRCDLSLYNPDGSPKTANCPKLRPYGTTVSTYVPSYPDEGDQFAWNAPGSKTVFVEFIYSDGSTQRSQLTIQLVAPNPVITSVACSVDITGKGVNIAVRGSNFGTKGTTLSLNDGSAKITKLTDNLILANASAPSADAGTADYTVTVKRDDAQTIDSVCSIGVSQLSVGAKVFCRAPSNFDVTGVDVTVVEATPGAKLLKAKASIDKDGVIQGLKATLQDGHCYKMSIKTPKGVRKAFQFQAGSGTTVVPDLRLPIGDIFPVSGDGKINSLDRAELIRQWNASLSSTKGIVATNSATIIGSSSSTSNASTKTGDFNLDGLINSFDAACMVTDFNAENDPEVTAGPITDDPVLAAQCDNPTPIGDN